MISDNDIIYRQIAAMGANFDEEINARSRALFAPLIETLRDDIVVSSNIPYGDHARQQIDIYRPSGEGPHPILLFVPGGGFVAGDKNLDALFYSNIGRWFARKGVLTCLMNYRLAPEFSWPCGGLDVRDAVAWVAEHAADLDGDRDNFTLFAQSAGAAHAASYLFHPEIRTANVQVSRAVLASGVYDLSVKPIPPNFKLYFGQDENIYSGRCILPYTHRADLPIMLSYSEFDPPFLAVPTLRLAEALANEKKKVPILIQLEGHNHVSNVLSFGSGDDRYGNKIINFINKFNYKNVDF